MDEKIEQIRHLATAALYESSKHHKQWYLEKILEATGVELEEFAHEMLRANCREWEKGVAP